jgi:hypothetical protein
LPRRIDLIIHYSVFKVSCRLKCITNEQADAIFKAAFNAAFTTGVPSTLKKQATSLFETFGGDPILLGSYFDSITSLKTIVTPKPTEGQKTQIVEGIQDVFDKAYDVANSPPSMKDVSLMDESLLFDPVFIEFDQITSSLLVKKEDILLNPALAYEFLNDPETQSNFARQNELLRQVMQKLAAKSVLTTSTASSASISAPSNLLDQLDRFDVQGMYKSASNVSFSSGIPTALKQQAIDLFAVLGGDQALINSYFDSIELLRSLVTPNPTSKQKTQIVDGIQNMILKANAFQNSPPSMRTINLMDPSLLLNPNYTELYQMTESIFLKLNEVLINPDLAYDYLTDPKNSVLMVRHIILFCQMVIIETTKQKSS